MARNVFRRSVISILSFSFVNIFYCQYCIFMHFAAAQAQACGDCHGVSWRGDVAAGGLWRQGGTRRVERL